MRIDETHQAIISADAPPRPACDGSGRSVARADEVTCPDCLNLDAAGEPVSHIVAFTALNPQPGQVFTDRHGRPWFTFRYPSDERALWLVDAQGRERTPIDVASRWGPLTRARIVPAGEYPPGTVLVDRDGDEWTVHTGFHQLAQLSRIHGVNLTDGEAETVERIADQHGPLTVKAETSGTGA